MLRVRTVLTGTTGTPWYYNHYYRGTTSGEAIQALIASKAWVQSIAALQYTPISAQVQGDVTLIDPATGNPLGIFPGSSATYGGGLAASGRTAPVDQILIRLRTGVYLGGREIRGRWFVPGMAASNFTTGNVAATAITSINGINNSLLTAATGAGGLVVWSKTNATVAAVSAMPVWDQVAVMRSRRD